MSTSVATFNVPVATFNVPVVKLAQPFGSDGYMPTRAVHVRELPAKDVAALYTTAPPGFQTIYAHAMPDRNMSLDHALCCLRNIEDDANANDANANDANDDEVSDAGSTLVYSMRQVLDTDWESPGAEHDWDDDGNDITEDAEADDNDDSEDADADGNDENEEDNEDEDNEDAEAEDNDEDADAYDNEEDTTHDIGEYAESDEDNAEERALLIANIKSLLSDDIPQFTIIESRLDDVQMAPMEVLVRMEKWCKKMRKQNKKFMDLMSDVDYAMAH